MMTKDIDFSDIPEIKDFSKRRKNPFAERMKKGYTVRVHYPPVTEQEQTGLFLTDTELQRLDELILSEKRKRGISV